MKKAIMKKSTVLVLSVMFFTVGLSQTGFGKTKTEDPIEVRFLNKVNNRPLFQMRLNNEEDARFVIRVKDGYDNILYTEQLKGKNVSRNYSLDVNEADMSAVDFKIVFEITNIRTNKLFVYNVTKTTRFVEEIMISKL